MPYFLAVTWSGFLLIAIFGVGLIAYKLLVRRDITYENERRLWSRWGERNG